MLLEQRAFRGDREAQFQMGHNFYFGNEDLGIEANHDRATEFFRQAANNGHNLAGIDLAIMLLNSPNRTAEDEKFCFETFSKGASKNHFLSMNALSFMYEKG